jgi:hypothetical protein
MNTARTIRRKMVFITHVTSELARRSFVGTTGEFMLRLRRVRGCMSSPGLQGPGSSTQSPSLIDPVNPRPRISTATGGKGRPASSQLSTRKFHTSPYLLPISSFRWRNDDTLPRRCWASDTGRLALLAVDGFPPPIVDDWPAAAARATPIAYSTGCPAIKASRTHSVAASTARSSSPNSCRAHWRHSARFSDGTRSFMTCTVSQMTEPLATATVLCLGRSKAGCPRCRRSGLKRANAAMAGMAPNTAWAHSRSRRCALFRSLNRRR